MSNVYNFRWAVRLNIIISQRHRLKHYHHHHLDQKEISHHHLPKCDLIIMLQQESRAGHHRHYHPHYPECHLHHQCHTKVDHPDHHHLLPSQVVHLRHISEGSARHLHRISLHLQLPDHHHLDLHHRRNQ